MKYIQKRKNVAAKKVTTTTLAVIFGGSIASSINISPVSATTNNVPTAQGNDIVPRQTYDSAFKLPKENIVNFSNNGGENINNPLSNVFDGDINTYWETNTPNTETFKNHIVVNFDQEVTLKSVVYYPRVQNAQNKGFPTKFSIYASLTDSGEDFSLVHSGASNITTQLEVTFDKEINFKRLKFVFDESYENLSSAAEIAFYKPDYLTEKIDNLFIDSTMSQVNSSVTLEELNKMYEESKSHPDASLTEKIEIAKNILEKSSLESKVNNLFTDSTMTQVQDNITLDELNKLLDESKLQSNTQLTEKIQLAIDILGKAALEAKANNLFTDSTFSKVNDGITLDELNKMLEESKSYSKSLLLTEKIQLAIDILEKSTSVEVPTKIDENSNSEKASTADNNSNVEETTTVEENSDIEETTTVEENSDVEKTPSVEDKATVTESSNESLKASTVLSAAEDTTTAQTYDSVFRIPQEDILKYTNNAGAYTGTSLSNIFDGNVNTHWETNKQNTADFKNHIVITFNKEVTLGSMVYNPRVQGAANKGFPKKFSIYASLKDDGEDFTLVHSGTANVSSDELNIKFNKDTNFKRLKFVFEDSHENWSAVSELAFYKPDPLTDKVNNLFKDYTQSEVKDGITIDELNNMLEENKNHPSTNLIELIELAKKILQGENLAKEVFTVEQRGDGVSHARNVLKTSSYGTNILPTGIAALANEQIKVYVDVEPGKPLPQISFSQQYGHWRGWIRTYNLKQGENIFTVPKIYDETWPNKVIPGGAIYIVNPYTAETQGRAPKIRIEGGHKYPLFQDGDDVNAFLEELKEYKTKLTAEPTKYVDIVEIVNDYAIINSNMRSAESAFLGTSSRTPQGSLDFHKKRISQFFAYAGIYEEGDLNDTRNGARANMRLMQPWGFAYAAGDHTGFQQGSATTLFQGGVYGWAEAHEIGHHFDVQGGFIGEVTNNMWANYNRVELNNEVDRVDGNYNTIFTKISSDDYSTLYPANGIDGLAIWWQLHLLDKDYWSKYQSAFRDGIANNMNLTRNERMAVVSSYSIGMDITEHFERHKLINEESATKVRNALKELKIPEAPENVKPWYMWTKSTKDRESKFEQGYLPEILSVKQNKGKIEIKLDIDESAEKALLGYEIIQDGKILGFTKTDTFTTLADDDGKEHTYTVRAFDLRSNATQYSEPFTIAINAPKISVVNSTIVEVNSTDFDINSIVTAHDLNGKALSNITATGTVDTATPGIYPVTYTVTDEAGKTTSKDVNIIVASKEEYTSDSTPTSETTDLNAIQKNKEVKLLQNGVEKVYTKGITVPSNSRITYDISDKNYEYFEAFVGVDSTTTEETNPDITFDIWVDGVQKFRSGSMNSKTEEKYVNIDIKGAKEVVLVTNGDIGTSSNLPVWADAKFATIYVEPPEEDEETTPETPDEGTIENPNPGTGGTGTENPTPGTGGTDTDNPTPGTGGTDTENPTSGTGDTDTENPTPGSGGTDTENPTPGTGGTDTENPTPGTGGTNTENPTSGTGGTDTENPTSGTGGTNTENPTLGTGGTNTETPTPGTGGTNTENPTSGTSSNNSENPTSGTGNNNTIANPGANTGSIASGNGSASSASRDFKSDNNSSNNNTTTDKTTTENKESESNKANTLPITGDKSGVLMKTLGVSFVISGIALISLMKLKKK